MKKWLTLALVLILAAGILPAAVADPDMSYEGTVIAGETIPVSAPYGGLVHTVLLRAGSYVREGDAIAQLEATVNYSPVEGTVSGLYAVEGDTADSVNERYGAVLYIEPTHKYILQATSEKAFNSSENYFVHLGERVYLSCVKDGTHQGTGLVSALTDTGYTVEVTGGEFYLGEKVDIFRSQDQKKESCIGRGTVSRAKPVAVKGSGSILKLNVANGDFVERGEALFETVEGVLDGLYAPDSRIISPASGVIASIEKNKGDKVSKGDAMAKIIPAESFLVQFDVPESDLFSLSEGEDVTLELYWDNTNGQTYAGKIIQISYMNEEQKNATDRKVYKAFASFEPDERIRLGMTMVVYPGATQQADEEEKAE